MGVHTVLKCLAWNVNLGIILGPSEIFLWLLRAKAVVWWIRHLWQLNEWKIYPTFPHEKCGKVCTCVSPKSYMATGDHFENHAPWCRMIYDLWYNQVFMLVWRLCLVLTIKPSMATGGHPEICVFVILAHSGIWFMAREVFSREILFSCQFDH